MSCLLRQHGFLRNSIVCIASTTDIARHNATPQCYAMPWLGTSRGLFAKRTMPQRDMRASSAHLPGLLNWRLHGRALVARHRPVHQEQVQVAQLQVLQRALRRLLHLGRRVVRVVQLRAAAAASAARANSRRAPRTLGEHGGG
jgi:hypothetical protein